MAYYKQAKILPDRSEVYLYDELCKLFRVKRDKINRWEALGAGGKDCAYPGFPKRVKTPLGTYFTLGNGQKTYTFWWRHEIDSWLISTGCLIDIPPYSYRLDEVKKFTSNVLLWHCGKRPYPQDFPVCHKTLSGVSYFHKHEVDEWFAEHPEENTSLNRAPYGSKEKKNKLPKANKYNRKDEGYTFTHPENLASPLMGFVVEAIDEAKQPRATKPLDYEKACFMRDAWLKRGYMAVTVKEIREDHAA